MTSKSQEGYLSAWEQLLEAIDANQMDFPHFAAQRAQLAASVEDLRKLRSRRNLLRTEIQRTTQEIHHRLATCGDLVIGLRGVIRSKYGFRSDKLAEFGIKPIGARKAR